MRATSFNPIWWIWSAVRLVVVKRRSISAYTAVAVLESPQTRIVAGLRLERLHDGNRALPGGVDLRGDDLLGFGGQRRPPCLGDGTGGRHPARERGDQRILRRRRRDELLHLRERGPDDESRRNEAQRGGAARFGDGLVEPGAN